MKPPFVVVLEGKAIAEALVCHVLNDLGLSSIICQNAVFEYNPKDNSVKAILTLQQEGDT